MDGTWLLVSWRHAPPHGTSQPQRPLCRSGWCHPPRPLDPDFERLRRFSVSKVLVWGHSVPRVHPVTRGGTGEPSRLHTGQGGHRGAVAGLPRPLGEASLHFLHLRVLRTVLLTSCRWHLSAESRVSAAGRAACASAQRANGVRSPGVRGVVSTAELGECLTELSFWVMRVQGKCYGESMQ